MSKEKRVAEIRRILEARETQVELEQAYQFDPAMEHLDRAVAYVGEGELEDALRECELATQVAPFLAVAQNYRGMILGVPFLDVFLGQYRLLVAIVHLSRNA